jgi:hypothetical protein
MNLKLVDDIVKEIFDFDSNFYFHIFLDVCEQQHLLLSDLSKAQENVIQSVFKDFYERLPIGAFDENKELISKIKSIFDI